jgi:hypothetical protein
MRFQPALTQTTADKISPGGLCVAQNGAGAGALWLRVKDGGGPIAVVQIAPRGTAANLLGTIDPTTAVWDVSEFVVLSYSVDPSNVRFPSPKDLSGLVAGDLLIDRDKTRLVCVGPNPATGIGFVDLNNGEIASDIGQNPMLILSWTLAPGTTPA